MKYSFLNQNKLPAVITPDGRHDGANIKSIVARNRELLESLILCHGAVLFRGFQVTTIQQFADLARRFAGRDLLDYVGGASPRKILGNGVYTSTEYPPQIILPAHNELSYTSQWPEYLFFFCVTPPQSGGETPLGDSRKIIKAIDPEIAGRFRSRQVRYDRFLDNEPQSEYSWQGAFETEDEARVNEYCSRRGIQHEWSNDGALRLREIRPATAVHPKTGEEVWFNQADGFHRSLLGIADDELASDPKLRLNAFFGDGGEIDVADIEHVRSAIRNELVLFPWKKSDVLVVDNMLACHGRMPFTGPRKVVLAMA